MKKRFIAMLLVLAVMLSCMSGMAYAMDIPDYNGHQFVLTNIVEPTCTSDGVYYGGCDYCHEFVSIPSGEYATGHTGVWTIVKEATETEPGIKTRTCEDCGLVQTIKYTSSADRMGLDIYPCFESGPDAVMTRAQMCTYIWCLYGCPEPADTNCPFTDLDPEAYYYDAVLWVYHEGITIGVESDQFAPGMMITRGQAATYLWRAAGCPDVTLTENPFTDVKNGWFYYTSMLWAYKVNQPIPAFAANTTVEPDKVCTYGDLTGIYCLHKHKTVIERVSSNVLEGGYEVFTCTDCGGTFKMYMEPADFSNDFAQRAPVCFGDSTTETLTKAQIYTYIWYLYGCQEPTETTSQFVDLDPEEYYYKAVLWALENHIAYGVDNTHFIPSGSITRAQAVTFLWRAAGQPEVEVTDNPFTDLTENTTYYKAVLWAYATNQPITRYLVGTGKFNPQSSCTYADLTGLTELFYHTVVFETEPATCHSYGWEVFGSGKSIYLMTRFLEKTEHRFTNYVLNPDGTTMTATCDYDGCSETDTIQVSDVQDETVTISAISEEAVGKTEVPIAQETMQALTEAECVVVETNEATIAFDADAIKTVSNAGDDITLTVAQVDAESDTNFVIAEGSDTVATVALSISLCDSQGNNVLPASNMNNNGAITVSIPYEKQSDGNVIVYYVDENGMKDPLEAIVENGYLTFTTSHFSDYVIAESSQPINVFEDAVKGRFYYQPVMWAYANNITTGATDKTFCPDEKCTRGQVVTFLWRAAGSPEPSVQKTDFSDLDKNASYYKAVLWAVEEGITTGTSKTTFEPTEKCTRSQVVTFLWRYANRPAYINEQHGFTDLVVDSTYYEAVLWAVENGITNGNNSTSTFDPTGTCNRSQVVTFLYRFINL